MSKELAFTVFCFENYKVHRSLTGKQTAELFQNYGVFDYLHEFYDYSAHHRISNILINDIDEYLKSRNASFPS